LIRLALFRGMNPPAPSERHPPAPSERHPPAPSERHPPAPSERTGNGKGEYGDSGCARMTTRGYASDPSRYCRDGWGTRCTLPPLPLIAESKFMAGFGGEEFCLRWRPQRCRRGCRPGRWPGGRGWRERWGWRHRRLRRRGRRWASRASGRERSSCASGRGGPAGRRARHAAGRRWRGRRGGRWRRGDVRVVWLRTKARASASHPVFPLAGTSWALLKRWRRSARSSASSRPKAMAQIPASVEAASIRPSGLGAVA